MQRSPERDAVRDAKLREDVKHYRRTLQKISKMKTKILLALRDEGCPEASRMLQTPPADTRAPRCRNCGGCHVLDRLGPCMTCLDCRAEQDCSEHTRLCFGWRQPATTFVMGSTVTGISSLCNAAEYDLGKYKELVERLGEASLEVDATLDQFPAGAAEHSNNRFNQERRERDIRCEDEQLMLIDTLLSRYQEERVRLRDVHSDEEDGGIDDAVEVGPGGYGLTSQTETHYVFGGRNQPEGFALDPGQDAGVPLLGDDLGLGLGAGDASVLDASLLAGLDGREGRTSPEVPLPLDPPEEAAGEAVSPPRGARPKVTVNPGGARTETQEDTTPRRQTPEDPIPKVPVSSVATPTTGIPTEGRGGPGSVETRRQDGTPPSSEVVTAMSSTTTTTSSASIRVSSQESRSILTSPTTASGFRTHRRASSEGETTGPLVTATKDRLFQIKMLVAGRSKTWAQDMGALINRVKVSTGGSMRWAEEEIRSLKTQLDALEQLESSAWKLGCRSRGS